MSYEWKKTKTPGVRYREHPTRKHGQLRKDRYYTIYYRLDGRVREERIGWESQGATERKAVLALANLKEAHHTGVGARTLAETRQLQKEETEREEAARIQQEKEQIIFNKYFEQAILDKRGNTREIEEYMFKAWIEPNIGQLPLKEISPFILEKLKKQMNDAGKAPATIKRVLGVISQVFGYAKKRDLYNGDNPVSKIKKPSKTTGAHGSYPRKNPLYCWQNLAR